MPEQTHTAELIYLVIPPEPKSTYWDRIYYSVWQIRHSDFISDANRILYSLFCGILWIMGGFIALYALYYLKSILGIDLFPDKHLEDFVPVPGYGRWRF